MCTSDVWFIPVDIRIGISLTVKFRMQYSAGCLGKLTLNYCSLFK